LSVQIKEIQKTTDKLNQAMENIKSNGPRMPETATHERSTTMPPKTSARGKSEIKDEELDPKEL